MADLSMMSDADLRALAAGDATKLSDSTLQILAKPPAVPARGQSGFAMGLGDMIHGGAQLATHILPQSIVGAGNRLNNMLADSTGLVARIPDGGVDQMVRDREAAYQASRRGSTGVDWARLAGNVANPMNLALPGGTGIAGAMTTGGLAAAMQPSTAEGDQFMADKAKQIASGIAGGAVGKTVMSGLSRAISPAASTEPALQLLRQEGVRPTIGQTLGGWANALEEKAQSLPLIGDAIAAARSRAMGDFNAAALNRAGAPIGQTAQGVGHDAVAQMGDAVSSAYTAAKSMLGGFSLDRQTVAQLQGVSQAIQALPDSSQAAIRRVLDTVKADMQGPSIGADAFKRIDSKLGQEAARFGGSPDAYQQQIGGLLKQVQTAITQSALRANPQAAQAMQAADAAWANLVRVEGAAKAAANSGGVFTPAQLQMAVRQADQSVRDRATARGQALMQDLSSAGQKVLGNKVPDSGTAGRLMLGAGALGSGFVEPTIPLVLLAGSAAYSPWAQTLMRGAVSARPAMAKPVAGLLDYSAPVLSMTGGLLGVQVGQ